MANSGLVYPWDDSNFPKEKKEDKPIVYDELRSLRYNVARYKERPEEGLMKAVDAVLVGEGVVNGQWTVVFCNSLSMLKALAELVPIVYALSVQRYPMNISNEGIAYNVQQSYKASDWDWTVPQEYMRRMDLASLLYWENATQPSPATKRAAGKVLDMLKKRLNRPMSSIVFPVFFKRSWSDSVVSTTFNRITEAFGSTVADLLEERCTRLVLKVAAPEPRVASIIDV